MVLFMIGSTAVAMTGRMDWLEVITWNGLGERLAEVTSGLNWLIAVRVFQAIGAGALVPVSIAMVGDLFQSSRRGMPLGLLGASAEAGGVIGPLWGGIIIRYLDWRWVFWMNIPLGIAVLAMVFLMLRPSPRRAARIDFWGGAFITVSIATLTLALARFGEPDGWMFGYFAASAVFMALFVLRQRNTDAPLLPFSMFRTWAFRASNSTHLLVGAALIIGMVTVPLMANTVLGLTPLDGGLYLMRMTAAIPVGAVLGGLACQRFDYRVPTAAGLAFSAVGFWLMSGWDASIADPALTVHLALAGLGFGLVIAPIALAATDSVEPHDRGTAASLVTAMRIIGMTFGLAALAAWGTGRFSDLVAGLQLPFALPGETAEQAAARIESFNTQIESAGFTVFNEFFMVAAVLCAVAIIPALAMAWNRHRTLH
jgi:MFS family permease